jgi:hypothetical protein
MQDFFLIFDFGKFKTPYILRVISIFDIGQNIHFVGYKNKHVSTSISL